LRKPKGEAVLIRRAEAADASTLTSIALAAKRHWGYPEAWIRLWTPVLTITPGFIGAHEVFAAEFGGEVAGFCSLVRGSDRWELDHLYVQPSHIRSGIGRQLLEHAVRRLREVAPGATLFIEADPNAELFYLRMGARRVGQISRDWQGLTRVLPELELTPHEVDFL
jgi:GNAT superfamily N-acetyltransferase